MLVWGLGRNMQKIRSISLLALALALPALSTQAQESDIAATGEIVIEREEKARYFEHRVNGVLKEIKVVPDVGPVYYLVPADGGGWIREEESSFLVPKWVLFEW